MSKSIFLLFLISAFFSCSHQEMDKQTKSNEAYFDIKRYFENEKEQLRGYSKFTKTVFINGVDETKKVGVVDFENDLSVFIKSDINRPAWVGKYSIDSTFNNNGELVSLSYLTLEPKLATKSVFINYEEGVIDHIKIENGSKSTIAKTKQILNYFPMKGYTIESIQDVATLKKHVFKAEVRFE